MNDTKILIEKIKEGTQEKKGKNIIIADLTRYRRYHLQIFRYMPGELSQSGERYRRLYQRVYT